MWCPHHAKSQNVQIYIFYLISVILDFNVISAEYFDVLKDKGENRKVCVDVIHNMPLWII